MATYYNFNFPRSLNTIFVTNVGFPTKIPAPDLLLFLKEMACGDSEKPGRVT
jgi:hypothetical protein